jgi:ribonuclease HI
MSHKEVAPKDMQGGILYLSSSHYVSFKARIEHQSNNLCELIALKLFLQLTQEHNISQLQIFGDSLLVIKWLQKETSIINFTLLLLYDDIQTHMTTFSHISLSHIFRDKNWIVDALSKYGLELERDTSIISFLQDGQMNLLTNLGYNDILLCIKTVDCLQLLLFE